MQYLLGHDRKVHAVKMALVLQLSSSASPLSGVSAWGTLSGHGHTRHLPWPIRKFSVSAWQGGGYFTGVSCTHFFEKGCMWHGGLSRFPALLFCLSSCLECLLSAEVSLVLLLQRKLWAPRDPLVSERTEGGYPCWKQRGSRLQMSAACSWDPLALHDYGVLSQCTLM